MSDILSLISLTVVFTLVFTVAFHYWEHGAIRQATWWGFATFVVAALGVAFAIDAKIRSGRPDTKPGTTGSSKVIKPSTDRPWVSVVALAIDPDPPIVGKPLEVRATIRNTGRAPAKNVRGHVAFEGVIRGQAPNFDYSGLSSVTLPMMPSGADHVARFTISRSASTGEIGTVTQPMLDGMRSGQNSLYAHGRLDYDDAEGVAQWVEWCYSLTDDFKAWIQCPIHNDISTDGQAETADEANRAWLAVKTVTFQQDFSVGKPLSVVLTVTNTGLTPARDVVITGDVVSRKSVDFVDFDTNRLSAVPPSMMVIAPGTTVTVPIASEGPAIPSQQHIDAFLSGSYTVFARGFVLYTDIHGKKRRTIYCFKASGKDFEVMKNLGVGMSACGLWNTLE